MKLTPEQLDLLKRLQPFFVKKMGEWQSGDIFFDEKSNYTGIIAYSYNDCNCCSGINPSYLVIQSDRKAILGRRRYHADKYIRIPKPIDWQKPERGLWEMLFGVKVLTHNALGCELIVTTESHQRRYWDNNYDPFTALLKALAEQEGV